MSNFSNLFYPVKGCDPTYQKENFSEKIRRTVDGFFRKFYSGHNFNIPELKFIVFEFFPTKPQIPKRSLFLVIYLTCVPYYFINNLANESGTGSLRPILTTLSTLLLLLCVQAFFNGKAYQRGLVAVLFIVFSIISEGILLILARLILPVDNLLDFVSSGGIGNRIAMLINFLMIFSFWSARKERDISIQRNFSILQLLIASICSLSISLSRETLF